MVCRNRSVSISWPTCTPTSATIGETQARWRVSACRQASFSRYERCTPACGGAPCNSYGALS